ncbi:MAG: biotin/lipoyl-containing protein [Bacteroidales bacterium]
MKEFKFKINGNEYKVNVDAVEDNIAQIEVNGTPFTVEIERTVKKLKTISRPAAAPTTSAGTPVVTRQSTGSTPGAVRSPLPGVILDVNVKVGDEIKVGQKIAVLEAMKMENNINADKAGKVIEVKVTKGDSVLEGADLIIIG